MVLHRRAGALIPLLALLLVAAPSRSRGLEAAPALAQGLEAVAIPETELAVNLPRDWFPGGFNGLGVLLSYLGDGDGYPRFTVQHDPQASMPESATSADDERAVEELFEQIVELLPGSRIVEAGWTRVNGLRAHRSTTVWESVAGPIRGSRLILVHGGRPLILAWVDQEAHFPQVDELIRESMQSVRRARTGPVAAR